MQALYKRLKQIQQQKGVSWETIELDYCLSWLLVAIGKHEKLSKNLVFKGGTALKKCYFGDYRFSEDLDFSEIESSKDEILEQDLAEVVQMVRKLVEPYGQFSFEYSRYKEKELHPFNQEAFIVKVQMPWQRKLLTKIKLEISRDEVIIFPPKFNTILHEYGEHIEQQLQVYLLEEIIIEKFRAILQNQEKFSEKGWVRSRVRDFYDLWKILDTSKTQLQFTKLKDSFLQKCHAKEVKFIAPAQFFEEKYLTYIKKDWQEFLKRLQPQLPEFEEVVTKLKRFVYEIF